MDCLVFYFTQLREFIYLSDKLGIFLDLLSTKSYVDEVLVLLN